MICALQALLFEDWGRCVWMWYFMLLWTKWKKQKFLGCPFFCLELTGGTDTPLFFKTFRKKNGGVSFDKVDKKSKLHYKITSKKK